MAKHRKKQAKRAAIAGAAVATAVSVAMAPGSAQAETPPAPTPSPGLPVTSKTYFIGFPDWLPIPDAGDGSLIGTLDADPMAINNAMVEAHNNTNPLIGWGTGGVDLKPVWVQWYSPALPAPFPAPTTPGANADQYLTSPPPVYDHTETGPVPNPAYTKAFGDAYAAAQKAKYDSEYKKYKALGFSDSLADITAKGSSSDAITSNKTAYTKAGNAAVVNIPATVIESHDVYTYPPGYWTTTTHGAWVAPQDVLDPTTGLSIPGLANFTSQNSSTVAAALLAANTAPLLNWTAYITNVNLIGYGMGALAAGQAYQAYINSAEGKENPEGYEDYILGTPLTGPREIAISSTFHNPDPNVNPTSPTIPGSVQYPDKGTGPTGDDIVVVKGPGLVDVTLLTLILIRNPGTPNGGLVARFAPIYKDLTGLEGVTPGVQNVNGDLKDLGDLQGAADKLDGKPVVITALKANVGWEYDLLSDAPANANPIAWANSAASAVFLTNLLTGLDVKNLGSGGYTAPDGTIYYTLAVNDLPLLAPLRAPAQVLGLLTGNLDPNTPVADAIEPFLKILVNTSYTDAVRNEDGTWTRSLNEFDVPTLFGTQTLTRQQQAQVAGDLIAALGSGFGDESSQVLVDALKQVETALKLRRRPDPAEGHREGPRRSRHGPQGRHSRGG